MASKKRWAVDESVLAGGLALLYARLTESQGKEGERRVHDEAIVTPRRLSLMAPNETYRLTYDTAAACSDLA
jgi:hypothetical protein